MLSYILHIIFNHIVQSAWPVEYSNCISATGCNECFGFDTKLSDGEAPVLMLWECGAPIHFHYSHVYSGSECQHLIGSHLWVK